MHQPRHQFGGGLRAHQAGSLAAPFGQQVAAPGFGSSAAQWRSERVQHRIRQPSGRLRHRLDEAVAQAARGAPGEAADGGDPVFLDLRQVPLPRLGGRALRAGEEGGAELAGRRTEHFRRQHAAAVHDAAGGDHRNIPGECRQRAHGERQQREQADHRVLGLVQEGAAMAAGLGALQGHRVGARGGPGKRFGHRGGGADHVDVASLQLAQLRRRDHPERENRRRRARLAQRGELIGETRRPAHRQAGAHVEPFARHQRIELLARLRYCRHVGLEFVRQHEQPDRIRPVAECTDLRGLREDGLRLQVTGAERAQPASIGYRRDQRGRRRAGHRRLDQRMLDAEPIGEGRVHAQHLIDEWTTKYARRTGRR